jgi:hypothetical protein
VGEINVLFLIFFRRFGLEINKISKSAENSLNIPCFAR